MSDDVTGVEVGSLALLDSAKALEAHSRAEIDIQIATAKAYPRSITAFKRTAEELATLDEDTAASMFYNLPRDGKRIEGPSVRLAEVVVYAWGNLRADARITAEGETTVTATGMCFDLERNVAVRSEVTRRITGKNGKRYSEDMIAVTKNAACSIAHREAVFKVVPRALFKDIYEKAKLASIGKADSMEQRRRRALDWFAKAGVSEDRVLAAMDRKGVDDLTVDDLIQLNGYKTAIKDEGQAADTVFPLQGNGEPSEKATAAADRLRHTAEVKRGNGQGAEPEVAPPPTEPVAEASPAPAAAESAEEPASKSALDHLLEIIRDTPKGTGRGTLADDAQRGRLRTLASAIHAHGKPDEAGLLDRLADDDGLSKLQAARLLLRGVEAGLLEGGSEPSEELEF